MIKLSLLMFLMVVGCTQKTTINGNVASATGSGNGTASVQLSWSSTAGQQSGFYIEESTDGKTFGQILIVPDGTNAVTLSGFSSGSTVYFRIRAYNSAGNSPYTSVASLSLK